MKPGPVWVWVVGFLDRAAIVAASLCELVWVQ